MGAPTLLVGVGGQELRLQGPLRSLSLYIRPLTTSHPSVLLAPRLIHVVN